MLSVMVHLEILTMGLNLFSQVSSVYFAVTTTTVVQDWLSFMFAIKLD